jgi:hypothetical protein
VYCEKPLCQTIQEGRLMREAARKHNRVMQVGTQRRSAEHFASAVELVASGKIGKVPLIKAWINQIRISIGRPADGTPPPGVDYDCAGLVGLGVPGERVQADRDSVGVAFDSAEVHLEEFSDGELPFLCHVDEAT